MSQYSMKNTKVQTLENPINFFALANYEDSVIFLSGGSAVGLKVHRDVYALDLTTLSWRTMPRMMQGRYNHSSMTLGEQLYVFCGDCRNSIEVLSPIPSSEIGKASFRYVNSDMLSDSVYQPLICPLNDSEMIILSGNQFGQV